MQPHPGCFFYTLYAWSGHWQSGKFRLPDLSLRGPEGAVAISRHMLGQQEGLGENVTAFPRLPRARSALAMTNLGAVAILTVARSSLQHCAGPGCPLPYIGRGSSAVPSRECTPRALPRASRSGRHVGLRPPRNDKSLTNLWLSPFYRRSAVVGSAVPGPAVRSPTMTSLLYGKGRDPFLGPRPYKMENR